MSSGTGKQNIIILFWVLDSHRPVICSVLCEQVCFIKIIMQSCAGKNYNSCVLPFFGYRHQRIFKRTSRMRIRLHVVFVCFIIITCAGILKQSMGPRNRVGIGLSYRPARLHKLAESIPWNWLTRGSLKVLKYRLWVERRIELLWCLRRIF
jgi:hypothetical protein